MTDLHPCPLCKGNVALNARLCPHCGNRFSKNNPLIPFTDRERSGDKLSTAGLAIGLLMIFLVFITRSSPIASAIVIIVGVTGLILNTVGLAMARYYGMGGVGLGLSLILTLCSVPGVMPDRDKKDEKGHKSLTQITSDLNEALKGRSRFEYVDGDDQGSFRIVIVADMCDQPFLTKLVDTTGIKPHLEARKVCEVTCSSPARGTSGIVIWGRCEELARQRQAAIEPSAGSQTEKQAEGNATKRAKGKPAPKVPPNSPMEEYLAQ